jgi:hypothetical protein
MAQDRFRASNFLFLAPLRLFDGIYPKAAQSKAQDMLCARHGFSDVLFNSDFKYV